MKLITNAILFFYKTFLLTYRHIETKLEGQKITQVHNNSFYEMLILPTITTKSISLL